MLTPTSDKANGYFVGTSWKRLSFSCNDGSNRLHVKKTMKMDVLKCNTVGIFTGDGIDLLRVVREGDSLAGSTITSTSISNDDWQNERGQIAYEATLANGDQVVRRWTPDLHWRTNANGSWDSPAKWTLGLKPADVHDVYIDPTMTSVVTGPNSDLAVKSLSVGGGSGHATLNLTGSELEAIEQIFIGQNGEISGTGQLSGMTLVDGTLSPGNSAGTLGVQGSLEFGSTAILEIELGGLLD